VACVRFGFVEGRTEQVGVAGGATRNRVSPLDLLVALGGVSMLVGLALKWSGDSGGSGYESITVLRVLLILIAVAGIALPVVLSRTRKTDVPVIWEALLAPVASVFLIIMAFRIAFPPEEGAGTGMLVTGLGLFILTVFCWKALSRET
jgi:hypothetical protein